MDKIGNNPLESIIKSNSGNSNSAQIPNSQSYLLNEPIEDTISISNKENPDNKNDNKTLKWVIGCLAAGAGILFTILAIKNHKLKNPELPAPTQKLKETVHSERTGKSKSYGNTREETKKPQGSDTPAWKKLANKREKQIKGFKDSFENTLRNKSLEDLKREISSEIGGITNFDAPSVIVSEHFNDWIVNYNEDSLTRMYALLKKQQPNIKDPVEAEKSQQCGVFLLGRLRSLILKDYSDATVALGKMDFIEKKISEEVDGLLNHFGLNLPAKIIQEIKTGCQYANPYRAPHVMFSMELNSAAESCLDEAFTKHVRNNVISDEGKKLISIAETLNKKATEINHTMKTNDALIDLDLGSTAKTINNYKQGNFKSGKDEYWKEYFKKKYNSGNSGNSGNQSNKSQGSQGSQGQQRSSKSGSNSYHTYTQIDVEKESVDIFAKYGEDLGDINSLTVEKLRSAFRNLVRKYHPDINKSNDATEIMQAINNANDVLTKKLKNKTA